MIYQIKVGVLGGSFNPPHLGHIHISLIALKKLNLDEIWWLVTPQNRLKKNDIRSTFIERLKKAREFTSYFNKIKVLDVEYKNKLFSSYKTVKFLKSKSQKTKFVWIMGSDNLQNFNKWLRPKLISKIFPVAVIERPSYSYKLLNSIGASVLGKRLKKLRTKSFNYNFSSWVFIKDKLNKNSSTKIRNNPPKLIVEFWFA